MAQPVHEVDAHLHQEVHRLCRHLDCLACSGNARTDNQPFCAYNCTTEALTYGDLDDPDSAISKKMEELRQKDFRIYQLHAWEKTREGVWYAEKDI